MPVSKALADRSAFVEQIALFLRQNQLLRLMLKRIVLPAAAEYVFVVDDFDDLRVLEGGEDSFCTGMVFYCAFHIDVGKGRIKAIFV